jgi:hypothetical protein
VPLFILAIIAIRASTALLTPDPPESDPRCPDVIGRAVIDCVDLDVGFNVGPPPGVNKGCEFVDQNGDEVIDIIDVALYQRNSNWGR